ncbi:MAG: hypothetical protein IJ371_06675 [Clostridia bacterium]|nr:hypothetical protein [Clostridia bacterium]
MNYLVCCFIGHRKIEYSVELEQKLTELVENLIVKFNVGIFLFGSKSQFNDLCWDIVTKLKQKYPYIKRIYVRAEYNYDDNTIAYLLERYEQTFFSRQIEHAGKYSYVERNQIMIRQSDYCVFYYNKDYIPQRRQSKNNISSPNQSGTKLAFDYATRQKKKVFNVIDVDSNKKPISYC